MKIVTNTLVETIKDRISKAAQNVNNKNEQIVTGKKINTLSDEPFQLNQVLMLKDSLADIDQFRRNIEMGKAWLEQSENALRGVQDRLSEAQTIAVQMVNSSYNEGDRKVGATEVEAVLNDIMELVNSDVNGQYVFGGSKTDQSPFRFVDEDGNTVSVEEAVRVEYLGDRNAFEVKTSEAQRIQVGSDGNEKFADIFETLITLRNSLNDNDIETLETQIDILGERQEEIAADIADTGFGMNRLEFREEMLDELEVTTEERRANLEEVDIIEAFTELSNLENTYQAVLTASTQLLNRKTLMDFI